MPTPIEPLAKPGDTLRLTRRVVQSEVKTVARRQRECEQPPVFVLLLLRPDRQQRHGTSQSLGTSKPALKRQSLIGGRQLRLLKDDVATVTEVEMEAILRDHRGGETDKQNKSCEELHGSKGAERLYSLKPH